MSKKIQLLLAVAICLVALRTVAAQDTIAAPPSVRLGVPSNLSDYEAICGFKGDNNMYGKGIRIGMYLQWITSSLAYNFVPEEAVNMRGVNFGFTLANFVGLIYITVRNTELYAVECWIVLLMCMGGVASERGFASYKSSDIGRLIKLLLGLAIIGYWAWFVFSGMDKMIATPCSRTAFFFAKVDLYHWFRTFLKVLVILTMIPVALAFIVGCGVCVVLGWVAIEEGGIPYAKGSQDELEHVDKSSFGFTLALPLFILATELTIKWNHIHEVDQVRGTGQIFPVV
ncbi:hypothetical protein CPB86DRAFT_788060, partial [Serendipita vermifera]